MEQEEYKTCSGMLRRLQAVWEEIGESESGRDAQLLDLEARCFAIYEDAVNLAKQRRDELHCYVTDALIEMRAMHQCLGEKEQMKQPEGTLKQQVEAIEPGLLQLRERVSQRRLEFQKVQAGIQKLEKEVGEESREYSQAEADDLTIQHLEVVKLKLVSLQEIKRERIATVKDLVLSTKDLCSVLDISLEDTLIQVHESFAEGNMESANVSKETIILLRQKVESLQEEKRSRIEKLSDLGATLIRLCDLLEVDPEDQTEFLDVTLNVGASASRIFESGALSLERLRLASEEVQRLEREKVVKMKELVLKKRAKIEEICASAHMTPPSDSAPEKLIHLIESDLEDPSDLLATLEEELAQITEDKISRKEVLDGVERWQKASGEEKWLEEFEQDHNRYAPQRGQHLMLQRAEAARKEIKRLPDLVKSLLHRVKSWEEHRSQTFYFDGESLTNLLMQDLEDRAQRELEKKKLLEQTKEEKRRAVEEELKFGSKSAARHTATPRRNGKTGTPDRRGSLTGTAPTPTFDRRQSVGPTPLKPKVLPPISTGKKKGGPQNLVGLTKEFSHTEDSTGRREPLSPRLTNKDSGRRDTPHFRNVMHAEEIQPRHLNY